MVGIPKPSRIPFLGHVARGLAIKRVVTELGNDTIRRRVTDLNLSVASQVSKAMDKAGYVEFARYWVYARLGVDLQTRLFIEQVASNKGKPWSDVVTGFGVLRMVHEDRRYAKQTGAERRSRAASAARHKTQSFDPRRGSRRRFVRFRRQ